MANTSAMSLEYQYSVKHASYTNTYTNNNVSIWPSKLASDWLGRVWRCSAGGYAAPYNNAERQLQVNHIAAKHGAGVGTAFRDGVPGAGQVFGYGYGHGYYARPVAAYYWLINWLIHVLTFIISTCPWL